MKKSKNFRSTFSVYRLPIFFNFGYKVTYGKAISLNTTQTCPVCNMGSLLNIEKDVDIRRKVYSCGHREIFVEKNETMNVPETNTVILVMTFDLYDSVKVGGKITNSDNIEFVMDPARPDSVKQFKIKLTNPTYPDEKRALQIASEITNYLSVVANQIVKHKLPLIQRIASGKMTNTINIICDAILHKNFDLDANSLNLKLLNKNPDLNKRLQLYNDGLKELENNDFGGAIQSFYQCIENTNVSERSDYLPLRDAASHQRIGNPDRITKLNNMGIIISIGESLNENDPDNQRILKSKAIGLQQVVWKYLNDQISSL